MTLSKKYCILDKKIKVMEEKIKELKELGVANRCALEYDHCPDASEADRIIKYLFDYDKDLLIGILNEYEGWSTFDIKHKVFRIIEDL